MIIEQNNMTSLNFGSPPWFPRTWERKEVGEERKVSRNFT